MTLYLRPRGLLYDRDAREALAQGAAGALAGGPLAFTQVELSHRNGTDIRREMQPYEAIAGASDSAVRSALDAVTRPRPPLPGLILPQVAVMGVVNVTPDSFSDGGQFAETDTAIAQGRALIADGADILDVGGESTRPGADETPCDEERRRVVPVIEGLVGDGVPVSIDTRKAEIMRAAAAAGALVINDVTAFRHDPGALEAARDLGLPVVLMHSAGDPKVMQDNPTYDDVVLDVYDALAERVEACVAAGLARSHLVVDPGIGFGKTFEHNHTLMRDLSIFHGLGVRVMLGVSRKGFIGALTGEKTARNRVTGSVAAALIGVMQGVQLVRVHDVRETVQAVRTWCGILHADAPA